MKHDKPIHWSPTARTHTHEQEVSPGAGAGSANEQLTHWEGNPANLRHKGMKGGKGKEAKDRWPQKDGWMLQVTNVSSWLCESVFINPMATVTGLQYVTIQLFMTWCSLGSKGKRPLLMQWLWPLFFFNLFYKSVADVLLISSDTFAWLLHRQRGFTSHSVTAWMWIWNVVCFYMCPMTEYDYEKVQGVVCHRPESLGWGCRYPWPWIWQKMNERMEGSLYDSLQYS